MRKEPIIPSPTVTTNITVRKFGGLTDQSKSSEEAVEGDF